MAAIKPPLPPLSLESVAVTGAGMFVTSGVGLGKGDGGGVGSLVVPNTSPTGVGLGVGLGNSVGVDVITFVGRGVGFLVTTGVETEPPP